MFYWQVAAVLPVDICMLDELLSHGYEVIALGKSLPEPQDDSVRWLQADLADLDALTPECG